MSEVTKDPDAVLSYGWDWANFGANDGSTTDPGWLQGDLIVSSSWSVSGRDSTLVVDSDDNSANETSAVLSGGTDGRDYLLTNHIVTQAGYEDDRTITVKVRQR